jgi:hypothetical protein
VRDLYIARHERIAHDHERHTSPPPYRRGTDTRSRVIFRAAGSAARFS